MNGRRTTSNKFHRYFEKFPRRHSGISVEFSTDPAKVRSERRRKDRRTRPKASKTANATSGTTSTTPPIRPQRSTNHRRECHTSNAANAQTMKSGNATASPPGGSGRSLARDGRPSQHVRFETCGDHPATGTDSAVGRHERESGAAARS